jgi:prophage antirepressor-like protein
MNDIKIFNYRSNEIRTVVDGNGEPWWVAKDVCEVLGILNHKDAISALDDDEKDGVGITDPIGREQRTNVINEPGLYTLIIRSNKPEAKPFKRWITHEVLPAIRKTGSYSMKNPISQRVVLHEAAAIILEKWVNASRFLGTSVQMGRVVAVKKANEETTIDFSPLLTDNTVPEKPMTPSELAGHHGVTARTMNALLETAGYQTRSDKMWVATEKGRAFSTLDPYQSKNSNHTGYRLLWDPSILKELKQKVVHVPS